MRAAWIIALAWLLAGPALAEPLSFDAALARASEGPAMRARSLQTDAVRAEAVAAGRLPDPTLSFGVENLPVSGPSAGRFGADEMTMQTVGIEQEVPNGAKRRAARARAGADVDLARARSELTRREIRIATALAWVDLYYAKRRLAVIDHILATLEPLWESADAAVASGGARPSQALDPRQVRAELEDRRSELVAAVGKARAELARWTGDPAADVMGEPPDWTIDPVALRAGLDRHPSLLLIDAGAVQAAADVDLARAQKRPDWSFGVRYGHRDPAFGDTVSATASVNLPLFGERRQDPVIAARLADADRIAQEREDMRRALIAALDADLADHAMHHDQWRRAHEVLTPLARQRADLETESYGADRASLSDVFAAFAALAQAQLTEIDREAIAERDAIRIILTYGSDQ